jgi:hypothetical protein
MRAEWGRAGHAGQTFARPARPGPDDYLNLYLSSDRPGHLYVFRMQPDGTTSFQPPDHRDAGDDCDDIAVDPGHEMLFGTYRLNDAPGPYCFIAILAREPIEDICRHVEANPPDIAAGGSTQAAVDGVLAALAPRARILGHTHFSFTLGGE